MLMELLSGISTSKDCSIICFRVKKSCCRKSDSFLILFWQARLIIHQISSNQFTNWKGYRLRWRIHRHFPWKGYRFRDIHFSTNHFRIDSPAVITQFTTERIRKGTRPCTGKLETCANSWINIAVSYWNEVKDVGFIIGSKFQVLSHLTYLFTSQVT